MLYALLVKTQTTEGQGSLGEGISPVFGKPGGLKLTD